MKPLLKSALPVLFFPFLLLNPQQSKAEGGCPKGLFPVGGGYCRNIVCVSRTTQVWNPDSWVSSGPYNNQRTYGMYEDRVTNFDDPDAVKTLTKYKKECSYSAAKAAKWGNTYVPMR